MAGPSVRVNEWFSAYAMAGVAYSRVSTFSGDYLRVTDNKGKTHDVLTGSDDGRHSNTSLAWGLACSLTRPNPWPLILLMKAPAVATGALTGSSWVLAIILISQVTPCYDSPPFRRAFLWGEYGSKDFRCTERRHRKTGTELHNPTESNVTVPLWW